MASFKDITPPAPHLAGGTGQLGKIMNTGLTLFLIAVFLAALGMLIVGGIQWITSGGNPENLKKAQNRLTFAIMGLMVVLLSFVILKVVGTIFGVDLTRIEF